MNEKKTWSAATLIGGGLDGLMILAALDRIEGKLAVIQEKMRSKKRGRPGASGPCGSTEARV
jgi:hypothetical protein